MAVNAKTAEMNEKINKIVVKLEVLKKKLPEGYGKIVDHAPKESIESIESLKKELKNIQKEVDEFGSNFKTEKKENEKILSDLKIKNKNLIQVISCVNL